MYDIFSRGRIEEVYIQISGLILFEDRKDVSRSSKPLNSVSHLTKKFEISNVP